MPFVCVCVCVYDLSLLLFHYLQLSFSQISEYYECHNELF